MFLPFFGNISFSKKVNYSFRKYGVFVREYNFPRKPIICFENMMFSFENVDKNEKTKYLFRKYDFSQES